jgi:hypothetical protein
MSTIAAPAPGADVLALIGQQLAVARRAEKDQNPARQAEALRTIEAYAAGRRWDLAEAAAEEHDDAVARLLSPARRTPGGDDAA